MSPKLQKQTQCIKQKGCVAVGPMQAIIDSDRGRHRFVFSYILLFLPPSSFLVSKKSVLKFLSNNVSFHFDSQ